MNSTAKTLLKLLIVLLISGSVFFIPFEQLGVTLSVVEVRVIALFIMAALLWILEPIPIWTTSVLVITICLLGVSNQSLSFLSADRYDKGQVSALVLQSAGPDADAETVKKVQAAVISRLDKKTKLNAEEIRMSMEYQFHLVDMHAAAERLHNDKELDAQLKNIKLVNVMQQRSTMATFADPIIILFLGGFFLAAAATKYRLDINLAKVLLKPFGTNPKYVMLGLMVATALFSMFMSNTATTAMMLAILAPVLALFGPGDRGRAAFALCIPIAANIGGAGTPIGTPPNAIAIKALEDMGFSISFGKWMLFGVPFVIVMLGIAWLLLIKMFPIQQKELKLEVGGKFLKTPKAMIVYITFAITVILWVLGKGVHGMDSNTVAIIPVAVFAVTQVITKDDLRSMSWEVLWLVAGGFALGLALQDTGLAVNLINAIPFGSWNSMMLMVGAGVICLFMATFMSHTATASLLVPILAAVASSMMGAGAMDGGAAIGLLVAVAFASSLGMALPISTPPNALAYSTGLVESKGMAISGTILCIIGLAFTYLMIYLLIQYGVFA